MNEPILSLARVRKEAFMAFAVGQPMSANPYPERSAAYLAWEFEYKRLVSEFGTEAA